ncbi:MAG: tRNA (adenosine(37)-N6)-dimethylallyltransferase MiaA [Pseudobdellovibrio sp.]
MGASTDSENQKCIFVVGATASGKSAWALEQAQKYNGSIVNIDSIQFYRGLETGSAAPTSEEQKLVPHYLYSHIQAPREMTAGEYIKDFYSLVQTPVKFPLFIVGGTGFYIQALEKGMFDVEPIPQEFREEIEKELAEQGAEKMHAELLQKDPQTKIHVNDHYRLVRAIEIIRYTGKTPSELNSEQIANKNELPFPYIKVGFDFEKPEFEKRIQKRTEYLINNGIIEETKSFLAQGFENWAPLNSVGFKETRQFLKQNESRDWLSAAISQSTLQLVKKQKTWFKRDSTILWSNQAEQLKTFLS